MIDATSDSAAQLERAALLFGEPIVSIKQRVDKTKDLSVLRDAILQAVIDCAENFQIPAGATARYLEWPGFTQANGDIQILFEEACAAGKLDLARWLYEKSQLALDVNREQLVISYVRNTHVVYRSSIYVSDEKIRDTCLAEEVKRHTDLIQTNSVKQLFGSVVLLYVEKKHKHTCSKEYIPLKRACMNNQYNVVQWLIPHCKVSEHTCSAYIMPAVQADALESVLIVYRAYVAKHCGYFIIDNMQRYARQQGAIRIFRWACDNHPQNHIYKWDVLCNDALFAGHAVIAREIVTRFGQNCVSRLDPGIFWHAVKHNHTDVVRLFIEYNHEIFSDAESTADLRRQRAAFLIACREGWIKEISQMPKPTARLLGTCYRDAYRRDDLQMFLRVFQLFGNIYIFHRSCAVWRRISRNSIDHWVDTHRTN